jgi:hypothetical protein
MRNIHLLPTDKGQRITKTNKVTFLFCSVVAKDFIEIRRDYSGFHLYITSDEEIKQGDWTFDWVNLYKWTKDDVEDCLYNPGAKNYKGCKKIILTTDGDLIADGIQSIDDEFLEWFVNNPEVVGVEVEKEYNCPVMNKTYDKPYINYKIIIPGEEPKQEEEIIFVKTVREYEYIGECRGNDGNGCFMDSPAHNCGCFVRKPKQETTLQQIDQTNPVTRGSTALVYKQETLEEVPTKLESVLAKISHQNGLGLSQWYEVVYYDHKWCSYSGSKTFEDGERVVHWKYCKELF